MRLVAWLIMRLIYVCAWFVNKFDLKVEYHANENPLKYFEKYSICGSKVNVSNNQKNIIPYHAIFF